MLEDNWFRSFDTADFYFIVDGKKTYSRNVAIAWADGDLERIHLYWLDEVWESMDLTVRPSDSWDQLMRDRCLQVRDRANSLALAFSGGFDSQTILDHFISNNIRLDEIQINHKSYLVHPEFMSAVDIANQVKKNHYPDLKINTIDITLQYLLNIYQQAKDDWLWSESASEFTFTKLTRTSLVNHNYQHSKLCINPSRLVLEGHEKPRLFIEDGWWVMAMHDGVFDKGFNTPFENFYISRDLPQLHVKQVWMMIDWLENLSFNSIAETEEFLHRAQKNQDNHINEQWNLAVGRNPVRHVNSWDLNLSLKHDTRGGMYGQDAVGLFNKYPELATLPEVVNWRQSALEFAKTYQQTFVPSEQIDQFRSTLDDLPLTRIALGKNIWTKKYPIKPVELKDKK